MRQYQIVLVLDSSQKEEERKKTIDKVKNLIKDAAVVGENVWGLRSLSYPINRQTTGHFMEMIVQAENLPSDFEKKLLQEESILRHLVLRLKKASVKADVSKKSKNTETESKKDKSSAAKPKSSNSAGAKAVSSKAKTSKTGKRK